MRSSRFPRSAAGALAAVLVAASLGTAQAAGGSAAPWFGSPGAKPVPIPFAKPPAKVPGAPGPYHRDERFIRQLYRGFLGREPAGDEVRAWVRVLGEQAGATEVIRSFMESDEYFIRQVYLGLLRREPDASGRDAYARALRGGSSRQDVIESILGSEEFARFMR